MAARRVSEELKERAMEEMRRSVTDDDQAFGYGSGDGLGAGSEQGSGEGGGEGAGITDALDGSGEGEGFIETDPDVLEDEEEARMRGEG